MAFLVGTCTVQLVYSQCTSLILVYEYIPAAVVVYGSMLVMMLHTSSESLLIPIHRNAAALSGL